MPTNKKRITVNLSKATQQRIKRLARAEKRTASNFIEVQIERRLDELEAAQSQVST